SMATPSAVSPAAAMALTTALTSPAVRAATVTAAPASASATDMPRPMPRVPPVTRARLPSRRKLGVLGSCILLSGVGSRGCSRTIGHVASAIATDPDIGLFGVADKTFEHRKARSIFPDHGRGRIAGDGLPGAGLEELADPQTAGIARRFH